MNWGWTKYNKSPFIGKLKIVGERMVIENMNGQVSGEEINTLPFSPRKQPKAVAILAVLVNEEGI